MKHTAKKAFLLLTIVLLLTAVLSVYASAVSVESVTDKVMEYTDEIKAQFTVLNDMIKDLLSDWMKYVGLVFAFLMLVECFFGYKLLNVQLFIGGAYIGFAGGLFVYKILSELVVMPGDFVKWIVAGLISLLFAFLLWALKKVGLIIFVGCYAFIMLGTYTDNIIVRTALTAAVVVLCVFFIKYIFIAASSYIGGIKSMELLFGSFLLEKVDLGKFLVNTPKEPVFYVGLLVALLGIFVQIKTIRKKKRF